MTFSISGNRITPANDAAGYFYLDEFADIGAGETFMAVMPPAKPPSQPSPPRGLPAYLAHLWTIPVLNQDQELHCFRKLNYLKYFLASVDTQSHPCVACREMQDDAEALRESIVRVRNFLVESNLRLVVSIAKRHRSASNESFDELVCVGNESIMRAVDLFDFRRRVRFSTYAYQAVERAIFGLYRSDQRYRSRISTADSGALGLCPGDAGESDRAELRADEVIAQVTEMIEHLDDRGKHIVMARFGINRPEAGLAFHVIAKEIKLSTTRTVQLFNRSIDKMRSLLTKSTARKA